MVVFLTLNYTFTYILIKHDPGLWDGAGGRLSE